MRPLIPHLIQRLRSLGIAPGDSDELRMQKVLLTLLSILFSIAAATWLFVCYMLTEKVPPILSLGLESLILLNLLMHMHRGDVVLFRRILIGTLLCFPFVARWLIGEFATSSGLLLWGLLAPITALLCLARRESLVWFAAFMALYGLTELVLRPESEFIITPPETLASLLFGLNFAALSAVIYLCLRFTMHERARIQHMLSAANAELAREQARSEQLLLNILPAPIATRLKQGESPIADAWPDVCVMFADIVGFTDLASEKPPEEVFSLLNHVFSHFDALTEHHGLEKIKTIGDAYMVAGGLQAGSSDASAAMSMLALDMRAWLARDPIACAEGLRVRIGIGKGPVVAGVVGRRKFIYDLWGDTVNLASRITSECPPDTIQCDARTFAYLKYRFLFEDPVTLRLKGKGMVSVWRLLGRNSLAPQPPEPLDLDLGSG